MLTPYFELSQTDKEVILTIKAPMANVAQTEMSVEGEEIVFYSSPYYLRIHLPGKVQDLDIKPGSFNSDSGEFKFSLEKVTEGEYFPDLDMIGKLLNPRKANMRPEIRLLNDAAESEEEEDDNEWLITQEPFELPSFNGVKFGFAGKYQGLTNKLRAEFYEVLDVTDIECTDRREWTRLREESEASKFSEDHYLADFMDPEPLNEILKFVPSTQDTLNNCVKAELTTSEKDYLKGLGNKDWLLCGYEKRNALFSLVDIIYAYAYNHRTTLGESGVESAWNINKLSSTLSWLEVFTSMRDVKLSGIRRSLVYPLYRHWDLSMAVVKDTIAILKLGRRQILKCLIEIHQLFNSSEPRYLLNQFYINDYCIWVQKVSDKTIGKLAEAYSQIQVSKSEVELDLEELEKAAILVQEEERELLMVSEFRMMALNKNKFDSDSNSSSEDEFTEATENEEGTSEYESSQVEESEDVSTEE